MKRNNLTVKKTLINLGLVRDETIEVFSNSTRDNINLKVYRDRASGVIFIDDFFIGESEYIDGRYRNPMVTNETDKRMINYEDCIDSKRRFSEYMQFIAGKNILDFGCGEGSFLKIAKTIAKNVCGVELQVDCVNELNKGGINCVNNIGELPNEMDSIFLFHSFEHLPDPINTLTGLRNKLKPGGDGRVVIEVPHANDFLLGELQIDEFKKFTLWSQHLVLHTRESLKAMLAYSGFKNIRIHGIQRYGLANHIHWISNGLPGGHKSNLSVFEDLDLFKAYANALSRIDANDTLVAIGEA